MSIIGSAWGQETVSKTVEITPDNVTMVSKNNYCYTADNLSVTLNAEENTDKKDGDGNAQINFKINSTAGRHITVTPENGTTITKVVLWGLEKQRPIKVTYNSKSVEYTTDTSTDNVIFHIESGDNKVNTTWTATFKEGYDSEIKFEHSNGNLHINKIEVTYTYTPVAATGISLNQTTAVLAVGEGLTLNATVEPADATTETIWSTSDESVATVENGVVTALKAGVVTITATNNGLTATCTVVVPEVLSVGTTQKTATVANITSFNKCVITRPGQLMDSAKDGATVTFQVTPEVSGTYSFTSKIATAIADCYVTFSCEDVAGNAVTVENGTKNITSNSWTEGDNYTWTAVLESGKTYEIKLLTGYTNKNDNQYTVNIYDMTIVRVVTQETTTTFNVSYFRYAGQSSSKDQILDRTIGGFSFTYTGGEAIKYNGDDNFFFREKKADGTNYQGTLTIAPTDANNKITQIVIESATDVSAVNGFTVTADGNSVTPVLANGSITIEVPAGASSVVISTNELSTSVNISSYTISTTDQPSEEPYQPVFTFDHASLTVAKTGGVSNALTTTPKNYLVTFSSSNPAVATVNAQTGAVTPVAAGTTTITVLSTATDYFNAANASYSLTVVDDESVAGKTWDFTTWSTKDITTVAGGTDTWNLDDNDYYKNKTGEGTKTDFGLDVMDGLLFTTTGSDQVRIYPNSNGQTDGSIRLQSKNAKIYMPALKAGQTITLTMMTASASDARGIVFSGAGADKVQLIYGAETSKTMNVVTYRVTEDINAEELVMSASTGGLYLYSIKLGYSELYWTDGSNPVTDVAVTAAGETSYTLNSAAGASYTITDANGNTSEDVVIDNGKVKVNTFTLGKTHTITATVDGHSATLTLRMVNTASISYEQTTAEGTLGFSFVEPVLTKNPEGLNVVKWKSSNPEVATVVADNGEVTFVSAGTTTITAYIEANNYYAYKEASYTLTVNEKPDNMQEPWTLELVVADGESVAVGSTGHKLTMTSAGTIKAGQVTTAIPGLTLSFGKTGGNDWTVAQDNNHFSGLYVADADPVTLPEESYIPTGGAYLGLEPTVNGVLSLHTAYYGLQSVVVVDKETNTVVASRRIGSSTSNAYENYEFTVPLQADRTYYVYNIGKEGDQQLKYDMPVNAITFTPVFLDRIGHVIVKNNTYNITGAQLADDIHDYPTFSHVHAEEGGSVHYNSTSDVIYLDEEGNLVIDGEGTATLQAHVSHTDANGADCHSVAQCTVTYTKSQLKFSGTGYIVAENLVDEFVEPTLTLPEEISESTVAYEINGSELSISSEGNISKSVTTLTPGSEFVVTAKIEPNNIYYKDKVTYTIKIANSMSPFKYPEEITLKVGTRGYDLIKEGVITYGVKTDGITVGGNKDPLAELFNGTKMPNLYFNDHTKPNKVAAGFGSSDGVIAFVNKDLRVDARAVGTATVKLQSKTYDTSSGGQYIETPITLKINVIEDEDIVEKLADWDNITLRTWSFNKGFNETEINNLPNNFANQTHNSNTVLKVDGAEFWTIINGTAKTKSAQAAYQGDDGKWYRDESTLSYLIDESLPLVLTNTSYNYENTKDYGQGSSNDEDKLLFSTWREGTSLYGPSDKEGDLNLTSEHTLNVNTSLTPITGVDKDEYTEGYKGIQLNGKASFIKVTDVQSGMYMTVIADNPEDGYVQLASDGKYQALGECIFKKDYKDVKDPNNNLFKGNRVTNVFPYMKSDVTTAAFEHDGESAVTNIMVGYPAGSGLLNVGGGEKAPVANNGPQRTYGYATFVSPYNIDLTGQTALKAYICDYYGKDNNLVHMVQIKHIPANTPVMLKGYARDMYVLYISEGNKPVEHGISEEVFAKNRLVGALEDDMMVQPTEEGLYNGAVTTWHNLGLTQNKFRTFTVASSIAKGRAYLRITQEEYEDLYAAYVSASAASTTTKIVFEDTDFDYSSDVTTPTGIENLENVTVTVGDGHYYNLNGVRVNGIPTQKGIYIRNGKKIVVR